MAGKIEVRTLLALFATVLFWASAFVGIRAGLESYEPGHVALLRFLFASIGLLVLAPIIRLGMPDYRDFPAILIAGFLGFTVYHVGLSFGEVTVPAGAASLIVASVPVFTAVLASAFLQERLRTVGWIGMLLSLCGVALISMAQNEGLGFNTGALLILVAAVAESIYFVMQKPYIEKYGSLAFTAYSIWAGTLFMIVFLPGLGEAVAAAPLGATVNMAYLGIFPTVVAYVTLGYGFSRLPASLAASFLYFIPVLTLLIAYVWLGEIPTILSLVGGALALIGVMLVNTRGRTQGKQTPKGDSRDYS